MIEHKTGNIKTHCQIFKGKNAVNLKVYKITQHSPHFVNYANKHKGNLSKYTVVIQVISVFFIL